MHQTTLRNKRETNPWLVCCEPKPKALLRLFCFAYAGGGASTFSSWSKELPSDIETIAIQMPGLETRIAEPPLTSISSVIHALAPVLYPKLDKPFAFFGHSLGALISFELSRWLIKTYQCQPVRLFVSGNSAPQIPDSQLPIHDLPETDFLKNLLDRYKGIPAEVLQNSELLQLLVPGLRASIKMDESYRYVTGNLFDFDITAFDGIEDDSTSQEDLEAWREQTNGAFTLHMIPGNHFFIHSEKKHFLRILSAELTKILIRLKHAEPNDRNEPSLADTATGVVPSGK